MKKILFLLTLFANTVLNAQNLEDLVQVADEMYKFGDYKDALDVYKHALDLDSMHSYSNLMAGECYMKTANKEKSLPYLLRANSIDKHVVFNISYLVGSAYQLCYDFDNAILFYNQYKKRLTHERLADGLNQNEEMKKIDRRISECNKGKELIKNPVNVFLENMGDSLNTEFSDYAPVIASDESIVFFTSRRTGSTGGNKDNDNEFFEDIYFSKKEDSKWTQAANAGPVINSNLHEACIGLSANGKELFIYKDDNKNKGDIFSCKLDEHNNWSHPKSLGSKINTEFIENSIALSGDGSKMFFSSNKPGGLGGTDIYMCLLDKHGVWGDPVNLGEIVNTEYDDESPFFSNDGVLYFSSRGHDGIGGFDLFKSKLDSVSNKWSTPENLGFPINSPDNDIYFVVSADGNYGYYSSVKSQCFGDIDLYKIYLHPTDSMKKEELPVIEKPVEVKATAKVHINVEVLSSKEKAPLDAIVRIFDISNNKLITEGTAKNGTFDFSLSLTKDKVYFVSAEKDGYVFKREKVKLLFEPGKEDVVKSTILLDQIQIGSRSVLHNIYFDFDKATLQKESYEELLVLYEFLTLNPKVSVIIEGHTDDFGTPQYNKELSLNRAKAVVQYLVGKGVSAKRLVPKGLGETKPLASNDDEEEGRELNRRIELVVTGK